VKVDDGPLTSESTISSSRITRRERPSKCNCYSKNNASYPYVADKPYGYALIQCSGQKKIGRRAPPLPMELHHGFSSDRPPFQSSVEPGSCEGKATSLGRGSRSRNRRADSGPSLPGSCGQEASAGHAGWLRARWQQRRGRMTKGIGGNDRYLGSLAREFDPSIERPVAKGSAVAARKD